MNIQAQNTLNAPLSQQIALAIPTPAAVLAAQSQLHEFSFDCNLRAAISVKAVSRTAAEWQVRKVIDSASCNGGAWDNGDPALFEASINDNPLSLFAIDGDDVGEVDAPQTHVGALIDQIFSSIEPEEIDAVISRVMSVHPDADATRESFVDQMRGVGCIGESAIVRPEFVGANNPSVGSVQSLFSNALLADALVDWPAGSAVSRLGSGKHTSREHRIVAQFQPQSWVNDCATDIDGKQEVDVTRTVLAMELAGIHALQDYRDSTDDLVNPVSLGHTGPFTVAVTQSVCEYFTVPRLSDITTDMHMFAREGAGIPAHSKPYRVHLYAVVRVPVEVSDASSQLDAIAQAERSVDLTREFSRGEYADEVVGILVDEVGDEEHLNTRNYVMCGGSGSWVEEKPASTGTHQADPVGASLLYDELSDAFETLGDIVELHGLKTLTDLMCLQQAILVGTVIDVWPESSKVSEVLQSLPSSTRWLHYTVERN